MKVFKSFFDANIEVGNKSTGQIKIKCPECSHSRKNKNDKCLSVSLDKQTWNCHNCGWAGGIVKEQRTYTMPVEKKLPISENIISWFKKRGINKETLEYFKISESKEYMPQVSKEMNCINFNYYRRNTLVNIKFRDGSKNFKLVKDAELIFFNLNAIYLAQDCIITEGEIDCMSLYQTGHYRVISVPNGASKGNQRLEYLDNCFEYFAEMKKIIIATDGDDAGQMLKDELARRFGKERCFYVKYPDGCKDANDVLLKKGEQAVKDLIKNAVPFPVEGVFTANDIQDELDLIYKNGFPKGCKIGYEEFDKLLNFSPGQLTTWTGIPNSGKSAYIDQVMIRLSARHEWKWAIFSPEQQPSTLHIINLMQKYFGKPIFSDGKMNELERKSSQNFVNEYFSFMSINEIDCTIDGILGKAKELVFQKGINGLLIDPYNYIEHKIPQGYSETQYISEVLTKIKTFCLTNNIHTFLVAHPRKMQKNKDTGNYEVPTLYDIGGSAHFYNKTDNGITIYRDFQTNKVTAYVQKIRYSFNGKIGYSDFKYDIKTGRYAEENREFESEIKQKKQAILPVLTKNTWIVDNSNAPF